MAKAKFLLLLTCRGSCILPSSSSKKNVTTTRPTSSKLDVTKSQEMINLLNNFPELESDSDRELSFSFLLNNSLSEKDDNPQKCSDTEDQCKEVTTTKGKKKRRISRSNCSSSSSSSENGVLLNLYVPPYFTDYGKSQSNRETPCTTLAELEKREMEVNRFGCWPPLLRRKHDRNKLQLEVIPQLTY